MKRFKHVSIIALLTAVGVFGVALIYYSLYGEAFIQQIYTFHLIKGQAAAPLVKMTWFAQGLSFLLPLGIWGSICMIAARRREVLLLLAIILTEFTFDCLVSATLWPHYLLPTLIPLALSVGFSINWISRPRQKRLQTTVMVSAFLALIAGGAWFGMILSKTGQSFSETMGFAGSSRVRLENLGAAVQALTPPEGVVMTQPFEGLVCRRRRLINFEDNWGVMLALREAITAGKFEEFKARMALMSFAEIRRESSVEWLPLVAAGIREKTIAAVIPNYELPMDVKYLQNNGYRIAYSDPPYEVWIPSDIGRR